MRKKTLMKIGTAFLLSLCMIGTTVAPTLAETASTQNESVLPSSYDAREYGYITEKKSQGFYGTCWAFAATAAAESSLIKSGLAKWKILKGAVVRKDIIRYDSSVATPRQAQKGGGLTEMLISFFLSVMADVTANCISKWLSRKDKDGNQPRE